MNVDLLESLVRLFMIYDNKAVYNKFYNYSKDELYECSFPATNQTQCR